MTPIPLIEYGLLAQWALLAGLWRGLLGSLSTPSLLKKLEAQQKVIAYWLSLAALLVLASGIPLGSHGTLVMLMRGVLGDPSSALCALALSYALGYSLPFREKKVLYPVLAIWGLLFYPLALGVASGSAIDALARFDPYAWGFQPREMLACLAVLALLLWRWRFQALLWLLALALFAYAGGWLESDNLWDYLFDPLLWFIALGWSLYNSVAPKLKTLCLRARSVKSIP